MSYTHERVREQDIARYRKHDVKDAERGKGGIAQTKMNV